MVSAVELGYRATNLDLLDRLLDAMDLRLNLEAEPRFADIDTMIAAVPPPASSDGSGPGPGHDIHVSDLRKGHSRPDVRE